MRKIWLGAAALLLLPVSATALPIVYTIVDGGINTGFGCSANATGNATCLSGVPGPNMSFIYDSPPAGFDPASGALTLDTGANTLVIAMTGVSSIFEDTAGAFNGIDEIDFTSLSYTSGLLTVTPLGFGTYSIAGGQSVTVAGSYTQKLGGGTVVGSTAFSVTANISGGQCLDINSQLQCSFDFGPGGFQLGVGLAPQNRRFLHSFDVTAVPEAGTALLVGLGLFGLVVRGRRHSS